MAQNNAVNNTLGNATATQITWTDTTKGIVGTTTNDSAASGYVGEFLSNSAGAVSLTDNVVASLGVITVPPGDWDVWSQAFFTPNSTTNVTQLVTANNSNISLPSALNRANIYTLSGTVYGIIDISLFPAAFRVSLSVATTFYILAFARFTVSTLTATGEIYARRVR